MRVEVPRLMISGAGSGSGKTTVSCGVLAAMKERGGNPAAFKCGPDYIDPMFHADVLGVDSCNLDVFMCGEQGVRFLLAKNAAGRGMAVIEGVMGLYDGQGAGDYGSSNHLAMLTGTPQVLVVNARGQALTLAAQLHGYLNFAPNSVRGVILNNVTAGMYGFYRDMLQERLGIKVYGHLPPLPEAVLKSRHLGLVTPAEADGLKAAMNAVAEACRAGIDLDGLEELARSAPALEYADLTAQKIADVTIAVARDRAFCFYYRDNLDCLRELGAKLEFFSPLDDGVLPGFPDRPNGPDRPDRPNGLVPAGLVPDGLLLGGGYPEEHAGTLAANARMRESVLTACRGGLPVMAECGGYMYLCRSLKDRGGAEHPMTGLIDSAAYMTEKPGRFGYITLTAQKDGFLLPKGAELRGHEFHYSDSTDNGCAFTAVKANGRGWDCVHESDPDADPDSGPNRTNVNGAAKIFAGYPHFHLRGNPQLAASFVRACADYAQRRARG